MNFLEYKYPETSRKLKVGDLVNFSRYGGDGTRKTIGWVAPITKITAHKLTVFIPVDNSYEVIRNNVINSFSPAKDDLQPNSKASQLLRFASNRIHKLTEQFYA